MDKKYRFNPLFEINMHMKFVGLAAEIMKNDGKGYALEFLAEADTDKDLSGLQTVAEGAKDADLPCSGGYICHCMHFHHPWNHRGYLTKKSVADQTASLYEAARIKWQHGCQQEALYLLGGALHLVQDCNIPHHAGLSAVKGHGSFEKWLTVNAEKYFVLEGGLYTWEQTFVHEDGTRHTVNSNKIYDWIDLGSHYAYPAYQQYFAGGRYDEDAFDKPAPQVIANVLRLSAGFLCKFLCDIMK